MAKFTPVTQQVGFAVRPITISETGLNATVSIVMLTEVDNPDGSGSKIIQSHPIGQSNHWLAQDESQAILDTLPAKGETVGDALERAVAQALRVKGELKL